MKHKGVEGGTANGTVSLCRTCRNSLVLKSLAESSEETRCTAHSMFRISAPVVECNQYDDKTLPSIYEMKAVAWVLTTDKAGQKIGFISAKEYRKRKDDDDDDLPLRHPGF